MHLCRSVLTSGESVRSGPIALTPPLRPPGNAAGRRFGLTAVGPGGGHGQLRGHRLLRLYRAPRSGRPPGDQEAQACRGGRAEGCPPALPRLPFRLPSASKGTGLFLQLGAAPVLMCSNPRAANGWRRRQSSRPHSAWGSTRASRARWRRCRSTRTWASSTSASAVREGAHTATVPCSTIAMV